MIINKESPFQPGDPVKPEYFEGRKQLIEEYLLFLNQSTYGNPQHLFINGKRGYGKILICRLFNLMCQKQLI